MSSYALGLSHSGLRNFLVQRVTAVILACYCIFIFSFFFGRVGLGYTEWVNLFGATWFKLFSLLAFLSLGLHAWIGIWVVTTDYLKVFHIRLVAQLGALLLLVICTLWAIQILWGQ
ncbi:MAG TPA: succinate dehydrogenase, hydrophobic membrane anchor protein [Gammaproteobacteria bacterium]|nr:succinate dehydrogenase, hydrophobic membrane anchor protein [Gammaproteobacteria bacterium]